MKKHFCLLLLFVVGTIQPVLLRNGERVSYDKVRTTYRILNDLYKKNMYLELSGLDRACRSKKLTVIIGESVPLIRDADSYSMFSRARVEQTMKNIQATKLCDDTYQIDKDVAAIIRNALSIGYKGAFVPIFVTIHNPISWKSYFSLSHWKEVSKYNKSLKKSKKNKVFSC